MRGENKKMANGYANKKREELFQKLKTSLGKIRNKSSGIVANLSKKSLDKMTSAKSLEKSKNNGFSLDEHFEIAAQIVPLYENAILIASHGNLKNPSDMNVVSIKRFLAQSELKSAGKWMF